LLTGAHSANCVLSVFRNEKKRLRKMFWPKRDEITGEWRRLYNEELYTLYSQPNIPVIISRRMKWAHTGFWWGDLIGKDHLEDLGVDERRLRGSFRKWEKEA
jgi:hypothetical protein